MSQNINQKINFINSHKLSFAKFNKFYKFKTKLYLINLI